MKEIEEIKEEQEETIKESHKILNTFIFIVIFVVLIFLYSSYIGTKGLVVREYRLESNILTNNFSGLKIVHFSDLLYKSSVDIEDIKKLVKRINEYNPDIVLFTGNLCSNESKITDDDTNKLLNELSLINAKIGKYAIYGDLDYSYNDYDKVMESASFKILNNEYEEILYKSSNPMYLVGLPSSIKENIDIDESFKFYKDLDRKYTIVMVNNGRTIKYIDDSTYEVDLIVGGYSLNGSVKLPLYGPLFINDESYKYYDDYYTKGITKIFISGGIGTRNYRYRFLNKPSFNLYRLKSQS